MSQPALNSHPWTGIASSLARSMQRRISSSMSSSCRGSTRGPFRPRAHWPLLTEGWRSVGLHMSQSRALRPSSTSLPNKERRVSTWRSWDSWNQHGRPSSNGPDVDSSARSDAPKTRSAIKRRHLSKTCRAPCVFSVFSQNIIIVQLLMSILSESHRQTVQTRSGRYSCLIS